MSELPASASVPSNLAEPAFDPNAMRVLKERYFAKKPDGSLETPTEFLWRVASAIAEPERPYAEKLGRDPEAVVSGVGHAFYDMLARRDFMPNTPCLVNAGRPLSMLSACFVLPVPDSIDGIFYSVKAMALIQKSGGGCVAGDARVWSTFCGIEPIEVLFERTTADGRSGSAQGNGTAFDIGDLNVRTLSMDPATGASGLRKVSHIWKFDVPAEHQIVVRTREGVEVQTSEWHPFMVLRGTRLEEVRADGLLAGDVILGPEQPDAYWPWTEYRTVADLKLDEDTAWLAGFTLGDGSFGSHTGGKQRLRWFSGTEDVLRRVQAVLAKHGVSVNSIAQDPRGGTKYVTTINQEFIERFTALCGLESPGPKDATIRMPEMIGKSPLSVVRAFLAGLVDSDGTVDKDGSPLYSTASEAMAMDISALMSLLGFQPTVTRKEPRGRGKLPIYTVLLARLNRVAELAAGITGYMSSDFRKARLLAGGSPNEARQLHVPFAVWRDLLVENGLARPRSAGNAPGAGRFAEELNRWSCNAAGRVRRADLEAIAGELEALQPETAALLRRIARVGQEVRSVERATVAKPYYDLTVEDWNTYAAGRNGLAMIHNTGFAFSDLRHKGAEVHSTGRDASGPVSFMKVFNAATDSIKQGGVRRGANMGVLRVDHPDVFEFMKCKKELDSENRALWNRLSDTGRYTEAELAHLKQELLQTQINNFNISIGVTDAFMDAVKNDGPIDLVDPRTNTIARTVQAREIWDGIVEGAWQNGEPGVLFLDHPEWNPLPGLGPIQATNPCLTGDSLVAVADGRGHVRFDELAASGRDVPVYTADDDGRLTVRTMRHPRKTGDKVAVYKVTLDDASTLRATANHKFRLRNGEYKEVRELKAGDSLAIMTKFEAPVVDVAATTGGRSKPDYWWLTLGGQTVRAEDRLIAEYFAGAAIPSSVVPAEDGGWNKVDSLAALHLDEALEQGYEVEVVAGLLFVWKTCEVCNEDFSVRYVNREIGYCSQECNLAKLNSDPEIGLRRHAARRVTLDAMKAELREKQLDVYTELKAKQQTVLKRDWVGACKARGLSVEIARPSSPFRSYAELQDAASMFNHRVVSVEPDGFEDVYNGTVDEFHNFFSGGFQATTKAGKRKQIYVNNRNCGEQALHGWDSCNLGSINVGQYYDAQAKDVDWERLAQTVALSIRFLDNVIDANLYPLDEIREMVTNNRRVGLGIMGFADLLIQMETAYGSPEAIAFAEKLMKFIQQRAEETSELLARERGDFPNKHLSNWAKDPRPRRNAALLSIAPTGTISMIAGCSFGCEPYFGMAYTKHVMKDSEGRPQHLYYVVPLFEEISKDEGFYSEALLGKIEMNRGSVKGLAEVPEHWQEVFTTSADVTVDQHIDMLAAFQKHTCNAVSKTINAPNDDTRENVSRAIFRAYESGCKGFTYYRDGSRTEQVVTFSKDGDIKGANRDVGAAEIATPATTPVLNQKPGELDMEALLAKANALLEVR